MHLEKYTAIWNAGSSTKMDRDKHTSGLWLCQDVCTQSIQQSEEKILERLGGSVVYIAENWQYHSNFRICGGSRAFTGNPTATAKRETEFNNAECPRNIAHLNLKLNCCLDIFRTDKVVDQPDTVFPCKKNTIKLKYL